MQVVNAARLHQPCQHFIPQHRQSAACAHRPYGVRTFWEHSFDGFQASSRLCRSQLVAGLERAAPSTAVSAAAQDAPTTSASLDADHQWRTVILSRVLQPGQLVKLSLKAKITNRGNAVVAGEAVAEGMMPSDGMRYKQLTARPVLVKNKHMLQVSLLTATQDITKNYKPGSEAAKELADLLSLPWQSAHLVTLTESVTVQVTRSGKPLMQIKPLKAAQQQQQPHQQLQQQRSTGQQQQQVVQVSELFTSPALGLQPQTAQEPLINLQHDRVKATPINGNEPDPFLQRVGLQTADGRIKANMQAKFTQINEFLKLLVHTGELDQLTCPAKSSPDSNGSSGSKAVHVLDAGCGSSHLTFGTFHYLRNVLGVPVRLTGIDTNAALMQRSNCACADLGIADAAHFHIAAIRDFHKLGLPSPDIVLALHACDTATDEALAVGVTAGAHLIMSVPCCQKDIQRQYSRQQQQQQGSVPLQDVQQVMQPLLAHNILKQRQLDLLTDTFRAQLLRLAGYRADVLEFVSTEHTPRNLLIRAVKQSKMLPAARLQQLAQQYKQLRDAWGVVPHLEGLLLACLPPSVVEVLQDEQQ